MYNVKCGKRRGKEADVAGETEKRKERRPAVEIYSDGACKGNPGAGGYGTILRCWGKTKELSEGFEMTTNNRMELLGAIAGLEALKRPCDVTLTSDSKYLVDGMTKGWVQNWKKHDWKKADRKQALNVDLWERLLDLCEVHDVKFVWIKGHAGHEFNERCDELAVAAAEEKQKEQKEEQQGAAETRQTENT